MKILYHHRTRATDAQRVHILEIVRAFRALGHEVIIASLVDAERPEAHENASAATSGRGRLLARIPFTAEVIQIAYNAWAAPWLLWLIWLHKPAFIYERYSLLNFAGTLAGKLSSRPVVLEVNSPLALEQSREGAIRLRRLAYWAERCICNLATRVLVVTGPLKNILISNGVSASRLTVMTNGVNVSQFSEGQQSDGLRVRLGLEGQIVFGFAGWFRQWHGLDLLVDAFAKAGLAGAGSVLLLIGDGPATAALREQVEKLGLQRSVLFTGPVPHAEIPDYLRQLDVAVQPAANEYCCPMKILEYMGMALPIIAPRQENIQELVTEGQEARFFTPGNRDELAAAMSELAGNQDLRRFLGRRALERVHTRGYFWTENATRVIEMVGPSLPPENGLVPAGGSRTVR